MNPAPQSQGKSKVPEGTPPHHHSHPAEAVTSQANTACLSFPEQRKLLIPQLPGFGRNCPEERVVLIQGSSTHLDYGHGLLTVPHTSTRGPQYPSRWRHRDLYNAWSYR